MDSQAERIDAVRTAAAVLCLVEGASAPMEEVLKHLAPPDDLVAIAAPLRGGTRQQRAEVLASYLQCLAVQLNQWSLS